MDQPLVPALRAVPGDVVPLGSEALLGRRIYSDAQRRARTEAVVRWRARMKAAGRCTTCGARRTEKSAWFCDRHAEKSRADLRSWREENRSAYRALLRASAARW